MNELDEVNGGRVVVMGSIPADQSELDGVNDVNDDVGVEEWREGGNWNDERALVLVVVKGDERGKPVDDIASLTLGVSTRASELGLSLGTEDDDESIVERRGLCASSCLLLSSNSRRIRSISDCSFSKLSSSEDDVDGSEADQDDSTAGAVVASVVFFIGVESVVCAFWSFDEADAKCNEFANCERICAKDKLPPA